MKTFREFIFECYGPIIKDFKIILENFVCGDISSDYFLWFLSEGQFESENAFRYVWNLASRDPEVKDLLNQASSLLHGVDAPEPKKYVKPLNPEWEKWEDTHKSLRNKIKEIRSSTEISKRERGRQIQRIEAEIKNHNTSQPEKYSSRKGSKEINPEWTKWASSRSEDPEKDQKSAKEIMSRVSSVLRDKISTAREDENNPLNFKFADNADFKGGKTENDAETYYDNLISNIDAVSIAPAYRQLRSASGKWNAQRTGNAGSELSRQARLGDRPQGYMPTPKQDGETSKQYRDRIARERREYQGGIKSAIQKADAQLTDPSNPLSYIGISHKKGAYQLSAGEPRELLSVGKQAARDTAKREIQIPQGVKVTKELKDEIKKKREERVEQLMGRIRKIADLTDYRGRDEEEIQRRKEESQKEWNDLVSPDSETSERNFVKFYTARQKTGKDRYSTQSGTADVMVQVPDPKLSTERKPQGTQITTTANRGAEKVFEPYVTKSKASSSKPTTRPLPSRQGSGAAPETSISDLQLPLKGVTSKYISRDLTQAQRQAQAQQELETQQAAQALKDAEKEKAEAQKAIETNPDGSKTYLQYQGQKIQNNPELNTRLVAANQNIQTASVTLDTIRQRAAQAQQRQTQPAPEQQPVQTQPAPEQQPVQTQPTQPAPEQQPVQTQPPMVKSKSEPYKKDAIDRDGDGLVQDGTPHERPAPAPEPKKKKNPAERMASAYDKKVDELIRT